jgi:methionyl-tRNA formyltransferase
VLFLGREDSAVLAHLRGVEPDVLALPGDVPVTTEYLAAHMPAFAVVHGYRLILRPPVLAWFPERIVNLHISYLPWNRGSDPNLWSVLEDTPKGVTLHHIDAGVDTGDIIAQTEVAIRDSDTLAQGYDALQAAGLELFRAHWPAIKDLRAERRRQVGPGTVHRVADRAAVDHLLTEGWDTLVGDLRGRLRH